MRMIFTVDVIHERRYYGAFLMIMTRELEMRLEMK